MTEVGGLSCAQLREMGAELALGVLPATERANAIAHLQSCPACHEDIRELTLTADRLVGVIPGSEPPVGFESRVLRRLGLSPAHRIRRRVARYRFALPAAAAAAALAFGGVGGWVIGASQHPNPPVVSVPGGTSVGHSLFSAKLVASGRTIGRALISTGPYAWFYMSLDAGGTSIAGKIKCQIERGDGSSVTFGPFTVTAGYGHWDGPYPQSSAPVTGLRLLSADGSVLADAAFVPMYPPLET
ncbi:MULTISPECIES: hypothetical protein [Kitasatospora]|uniref:Zinc-finger domain-containing protein n=1 Tax=Kitasatospora cystarginea TaxID=58350 RepID=A0ABN3ERD9_9ACTN